MHKFTVAAVFFASVYWVFGFVRPEWCNFHEQYQMFLFGWDYLGDHLAVASGMAGYLAEMVVQFFFFPKVGAALWALLLVAMALLSSKAASRIAGPGRLARAHPALALAPSVAICIYCGNQNMMLAFPMSIVMALSAFLLYSGIGSRRRIWAQAAIVPALYWLCGYGVLVYAVLSGVSDFRKFCGRGIMLLALPLAYAGLFAISAMAAAYSVMRQYPLSDVFCGVNFYRENMIVPAMQHISAAAAILSPLAMAWAPGCRKALAMAECAVASAAVPLLLPFSHDSETYSLLKIDYLVRNQRWDDVIEHCKAKPPLDPMGYTGLNLALAKTGQLPEMMFCFPQAGRDGMVGVFGRNMVSCVITGEVFYHLGLINQVLRIYFDSQASILNRNRSARFTHRIAECYLINGRYDVAAKYIRQLKKTLFYSSWAREAEEYLGCPQKIAQSRRWQSIVRRRLPSDVMYTVTDMSEMLIMLYMQSPENKLALQYALAVDLLNGDLGHFMKNLPLTQPGKKDVSEFSGVPKSYQEAAMYAIMQQSGGISGMPPFISPSTVSDFEEFSRLMSMGQMPAGRLYATYWRYFVTNRI